MKFYLAGQTQFGNRGCEALTRTVITTLSERFNDASFLVPASNPELDAAQWPQMSQYRAKFVRPNTVPFVIKWWNRAIRVAPGIKRLWEPSYGLPAFAARDIAQCDAVLMIGGDMISLDYGPGSLFICSGFMDAAKRAGYPTMLFAASISPFQDPVFETYMARHLKRYSVVTLRESESLAYVRSLGVENAVLVADPAFCLEPEPFELPAPFDRLGSSVLGFNITPILEESWQRAGIKADLVEEAVAFLKRVLAETDLSIALIPHVDALDGGPFNSDSATLDRVLAGFGGPSPRVARIAKRLNTAQCKHLIGACRYFMGGRTHSTIAAWSQGIPTTSFAYSTKANGLNKDLFGSLDYVLQTPRIRRDTLWSAFSTLIEREQAIRSLLFERIPEWRRRATLSADILASYLRERQEATQGVGSRTGRLAKVSAGS
jgi:polysaccharide pyruvyl transferase WcaK-like protein